MAILTLSMLGLPVGHAMIGGSVLYLLIAGLDVGTAAEQLLNGMYSSYLLLAIPLFILAAEFMNSSASWNACSRSATRSSVASAAAWRT